MVIETIKIQDWLDLRSISSPHLWYMQATKNSFAQELNQHQVFRQRLTNSLQDQAVMHQNLIRPIGKIRTSFNFRNLFRIDTTLLDRSDESFFQYVCDWQQRAHRDELPGAHLQRYFAIREFARQLHIHKSKRHFGIL